MANIEIYSVDWLRNHGCPVDDSEPLFEVAVDFASTVLVGPSNSVIWLWLIVKSLRSQEIESISLNLPWTSVAFQSELADFRTHYPELYLIPEVGEYGSEDFLNLVIGTRMTKGQKYDKCLVALSTANVPDNLKHGFEVEASLQIHLTDNLTSVHVLDMQVDRFLRGQTRPRTKSLRKSLFPPDCYVMNQEENLFEPEDELVVLDHAAP